ncbi:cystathionine beta-lyase [Sinobaca qinghaiensis]|uniref:cysteine-S-conjugate beta-lyase n=1 Tax=Sinobaca qinghaiensis TaxID=342944 RepID=A0A419UW50_9BACL|nr:MalY/PatB family protein [Sinobaca qinghaiensis]RKD68800.1 cystathionine beta-lyase [Sinobaca qinghaiensis]
MVFENVIDRKKTNSMKWDFTAERYGSSDLWPMWVADMDFQAPRHVLDEMQKIVDHGVFGYHRRPESLQEATLAWIEKRFNWKVEKEQLAFTPGVVPAISHLIQTFTEKGDGVIIQPPVYYPFYALIDNNERKMMKNPLKETDEGFTFDLENLEEQMKQGAKMLLLCSPHNPIGRVWEKEELQGVAALCKQYGVFVVSDEIHADLILEGTHTPFSTIAKEHGVETMTCMAPSKTFNLAALSLSYVVFDQVDSRKAYEKHLADEFVEINNPFATAAAEAAYREGEEWLEELLAYLRGNVEYVKDYVESNMPDLHVIKPQGTYLIWIDMRALGLSATEQQNWLREEGRLAVSDGHIFGTEGAGFIRINVACPRANVEEGLQRLYKAYQAL